MAGSANPKTLRELIPPGMFVGTSLILRGAGRFLYGIRRPRAGGEREILEITGIGGGMENDDATVIAGVQREAGEEMGCKARLLPCAETVIVRGPGRVERVALEGPEQPAAVVFRRYRTPPHQPWDARNKGEACLVVFLAELDGRPRPTGELPALIWLDAPQIVRTARQDVPLRELVADGAELVGREGESLPADAWARLTDSQEALVLALGGEALGFYERLRQPSVV